jgi:uncharacterized protein YbjQ (UPF0145 family)
LQGLYNGLFEYEKGKIMLVVTVDTIPNKSYELLGSVIGNVVRTKHIGRDIMAGFKSLVGGEVVSYTELLTEARTTATDRMIAEAKRLGADAIIGVRYLTCSVMDGASEVTAFGTAVKFGN